MRLAVALRLDPGSAARVEALWRAVAARTGERRVVEQGYGPHLTLATFPGDPPPPGAEAAFAEAVAGWAALPVTLAGLALFPGPSPVLWAAPVPTEALLARHRALHAALRGRLGQAEPHGAPGAWVPHVTLAMEGSAAGEALLAAALAAWDGPIHGALDRAELVRFPPVRVLRSEALAAPN